MSEHALRVLLVDDEESLRKPLADYLHNTHHYVVVGAANGIEAMRLVEEEQGRFDVALIDEVLGEGPSGLELLKQIKARYPDIQVILFTGWGLQSALKALQAGAYRYFAKPFNSEELALTIRFAAEQGRLRQERRYMEALVKVSQGLTQTTQQDEQLRLAWDFVREQLDVSTFFIGLNTPNKRIYFPLAYDEGQQIDLEDTVLGKSRREWGLAGYVIKTGEEILWSTLDELKQIRKAKKTIPIVVGKPSASGFCIPLRMGDQIRGVLSAQSYRAQGFTPVLQNALRALGGQLSVALENSRLFAEAEQKTTDIKRQASSLAALQGLALTINSSLNPDEILTRTCQTAVEFFYADSSELVLFDSEFIRGKVEAEYPALGALGKIIPVRGTPAWEQLIETRAPLNVYDVAAHEPFGMVRDILGELGIQSVLIVPIISKGRVLGSFSLDAVHQPRRFSDEEIELCKTFAAQVAAAIENARLFEEAKRWAEQLEALRHTTLAITSPLDRTTLLDTLVKQAVELLDAESGGVYEYSPERGELTVIADHKRPTHLGKTLRVGEGMTGRLVQSGAPFLIVENYNEWSGRESIYADGRPFGAVLEVPLKWHENVIGVLYIDDEVGRKFTSADAHLLRLFADQAAIALVNAELIARNEDKLRRLEKLAKATKEITGNLGTTTLDERLTLIAKYATEILEAETCGVHLVKREGYLSLEASYGHRAGGFQKGKEFAIRTGPKSGLTGYIAFDGKLFNRHGDDLVNHFAVWNEEPNHTPSGACCSLLAIPLKKKVGAEEKLIGVLRIDNKRDRNGRTLPSMSFTQEDEWILSIFAETVVVALESAKLVGQLNEQKDHLARLIVSSPNGICAIDRKGNVTGFNERAQEILGYTADEVMNMSVDRLYHDSQEPRKIGGQLRAAADGKLANYDTFVRSKAGQVIPIRLSATWLYDAQGQRIGSVGYFEDLRSIKEVEQRLELLLKASHTLAEAESPTEGLQSLAEMVASLLTHTFCRIFLLDESGKFLVVKAAYPIPRSKAELSWEPGLEQRTAISEWQGLRRVLEAGIPTVLKWSDKQVQPVLVRFSRWLGLEEDIQSLLMVPLKMRNRVVGLLEVGETRGEERVRFTDAEIELASAIAAETTTLIDRMRLNEITERRKAELEHLHEAAKAMAGAFDIKQVLQTIVERAKDMLQADSSAIWSYDNIRDKFIPEELAAVGIPEQELQRFREEEPAPGKTAYTVMEKGWIGVTDISSPEFEFLGQPSRELMVRIGVKSFQGIALRVGDEPVGVLYVNYKQPRTFGEEDLRYLENLATYAALSLKRVRLLEQVGKARNAAKVVAQVSVLEELSHTLASIVRGTQEVLGCDAVTLYTYDQELNEFGFSPATVGVENETEMLRLGRVAEQSVVRNILALERPHEAEDASSDSLMQGPFVSREKIKSSVGIPLRVGDRKVGVMFVNYRSSHRFTADETTNIELFANQAAVAIRNAQLHDETRKRADVLEGLYTAGKAVTEIPTLNEILERIAEQAWHLVGQPAGYTSIRLVENEKAKIVAAYPAEEFAQSRATFPEIDLRTGVSGRFGVPGRAIRTGKSQLVDDVSTDNDYLPTHPETLSELATPIKLGEQVIGVISAQSPELRAFDKDDERTLDSLASYAAVAINNAQLYDQTKKRAEVLAGLYEAGKAITSTLAADEVLTRIAEQALHIVGANPQEGCFSHIALLDGDKLRFIAGFPLEILDDLRQNVGEIDLQNDDRKGIDGLTVITRQSKNEPEVSNEPNWIPLRENINIHSQLSVPLKIGERIIGVLSIEHPKPAAFGDEDVRNVELLAAQATVAIENARRYEELQKTKEALVARTALAWTGMISSTWRHTIEKHAITIREQIELLRYDLARLAKSDSVNKRLEMIERLAKQILEKPMTAPLSAEEGGMSVPINGLIRERTNQLWKHDTYKPVALEFHLSLEDSATTRASPEWLRRALDILIDNAIDATQGLPKRQITIATRQVDHCAEVSIRDNGRGIPPEIQEQLFRERIEKSQGAKGLGMGLLFAQTIVQTYGGEIQVGETGATGTTMIVSLPLEN